MSPTDEVIGTWPGFRYVDKHTGEDIIVPYGNDDAVKNPIDLQKARALLAEAGFTEDNPLKITYNTFNIAYHSSVAQLMAQQFKAFGVETEIKPLDVPTNFAEITAGRYQIFHITRATDILDSDELLLGNYMPGGVPIWENINIPRINDIFDLSSRESDFDERQKLIQEAGEILRQGEGSMLGLAWIDRYALPVSPKVKNFRVGRLLGENYMHESIWLDDPSEYPNFD
jgi:ABC-type transport system substrate-binding protein